MVQEEVKLNRTEEASQLPCKITLIDDKAYRHDMVSRFDSQQTYWDSFVLHLSEVALSPVQAYFRNRFAGAMAEMEGDEDSEASYATLVRWAFGNAVHIGIPKNKAGIGQKNYGVVLHGHYGDAVGTIDYLYKGIPYEIKSRISWKKEWLPLVIWVAQLTAYMATIDKRIGRIKVYPLMWQKKPEYTYEVEYTIAQIKTIKQSLTERVDAIWKALLGITHRGYQDVPKCPFDWMCRDCNICDMLCFVEGDIDGKVDAFADALKKVMK